MTEEKAPMIGLYDFPCPQSPASSYPWMSLMHQTFDFRPGKEEGRQNLENMFLALDGAETGVALRRRGPQATPAHMAVCYFTPKPQKKITLPEVSPDSSQDVLFTGHGNQDSHPSDSALVILWSSCTLNKEDLTPIQYLERKLSKQVI